MNTPTTEIQERTEEFVKDLSHKMGLPTLEQQAKADELAARSDQPQTLIGDGKITVNGLPSKGFVRFTISHMNVSLELTPQQAIRLGEALRKEGNYVRKYKGKK